MDVSDPRLEESRFYIYRADTHQVLARDIDGYEAAKAKATRLRHQLGLKWDQVKFKAQRSSGASGSSGLNSIDTSRRYNPSKRTHFRGYYDHQGNFHDLD